MNESFAEFFTLGLITMLFICTIVYGPMFVVGGLMYLAGL